MVKVKAYGDIGAKNKNENIAERFLREIFLKNQMIKK